MTRDFLNKLYKYGTVDTRKYRYRLCEKYNASAWWLEVRRIELQYLDTSRAFEPWELVKIIDDANTQKST